MSAPQPNSSRATALAERAMDPAEEMEVALIPLQSAPLAPQAKEFWEPDV